MKTAHRLLPLIPALLIYTYLAHGLNFTQDDAYISYRYVANYLNGDGLVYNIGERVEGFTNFGWVVYLIMWGALGVNYVLISKITGFLLGAAVIVLTFFLERLVFPQGDKWFAILPAYLVAGSLSFAYWSPAGLETAAFCFFTIFSLYCYLKRTWWLIWGLVLLVWIRPEGVLVAGLLVLVEVLTEKRLPRFSLSAGVAAFVASLPYVGFKVLYYRSLLPNPFYAKTGFSLERLTSGLEYAARFFGHYWFYGIGLIVPVLFIRRLSNPARSLWVFTILYVVYIVGVGGDVLKVHRFFLPLFGTFAILFTLSAWFLAAKRALRTRVLVVFFLSILVLSLTYYLTSDFVLQYRFHEIMLTRRMQFLASKLKEADSTNFSVAISTIGIFGYELLGHDVIDLLGLTDSTIARHPEDPIPGVRTTWKEQKYNSQYVLERAPDYIAFSTGAKPSAPAEQSLLLYRQFIESYRAIGWPYRPMGKQGWTTIEPVFKKVGAVTGDLTPTYPIEYVQLFKTGLKHESRHEYKKAIESYARAMAVSPQPYYPYIVYEKALCHMDFSQEEYGWWLLDSLVQEDSLFYEAHRELYFYARLTDDPKKAETHKRWLQKLVPWFWPEIKASAEEMLAARRRALK